VVEPDMTAAFDRQTGQTGRTAHYHALTIFA
jgi:hypothetical protein